MWNPFKCSHPSDHLVVEKDQTIKKVDDLFDQITIHLFCSNCGKEIDIKYSKPTRKFYEWGD